MAFRYSENGSDEQILLVPEAGIEPARAKGPRDFKSLASAYSATPALVITKEYFAYSFSQYIIAP